MVRGNTGRRGAGGRAAAGGPILFAALALLGLAGCESATPPQRQAAPGASAQAATLPDAEVRADIERRWREAGGLDDRLDVTVRDGRALLTGQARTADERVEGVRLAWQSEGVQEVINEVGIGDSSGLTDAATDLWITTQLRSKLLVHPQITSGNFTIETVNQTVYLMGKARSQVELDLVTGLAREISRVRRVVSHVRV